MIGPLPGGLSLVSLPIGNIGKKAPAFKIESANGAGAVLERAASMKTKEAGTTISLHIASVVARRSHDILPAYDMNSQKVAGALITRRATLLNKWFPRWVRS